MSSKNLWADLNQIERVRAPKTVLLEQAEYLTDATEGALVGTVVSSGGTSSSFVHYLNVRVPVLNNYSVTILSIVHDIELYPVRLMANKPSRDVTCKSESEFEDAIESVLSSLEIKTLLSRLMSQVA